MNQANGPPRRIILLPEDIARKIAAGEVIDRPFSVVRELLDNAIDAGSSEVSVYVEKGGLQSMRVADNGSGMSRADLEICYLPHSTSKIKSIDDLFNIRTLGFRGEAISSMAVCSQLEITSRESASSSAYKLTVSDGRLIDLKPHQGTKGTTVLVTKLFFNIPARKHFLKSAAAETAQIHLSLVEKALAHPGIVFKLFTDGKLKTMLKGETRKERLAEAYRDQIPAALLTRVELHTEIMIGELLFAMPDHARHDRRFLQFFINQRRIYDSALFHAVEYAFSAFLPGGRHPVCFIFLQIEPSLLDFNIHPAKREVRFHDVQQITGPLIRALKQELEGFSLNTYQPAFSPHKQKTLFTDNPAIWSQEPSSTYRPCPVPPLSDAASRAPTNPDFNTAPTTDSPLAESPGSDNFVYLGQLFCLFLVCEYQNSLYLIDQHAAHERILYDRLAAGPLAFQQLLVPVVFDTSPVEAQNLSNQLERLAAAGIILAQKSPNLFEIRALCTHIQTLPAAELVEALKDPATADQPLKTWQSSIACRAAVKNGDVIDSHTARFIIRETFKMPNARCPHGRKIFHTVSRDELLHLVDREI